MARSFYEFGSYDQNDCNFLTQVHDKDGGGPGVRFSLLSAFCTSCGNFDSDTVFAKGFEHTLTRIRVRKGRNILRTNDGFLCVSPEVLKALTSAKVKGFESKPLYTGMYWHVLRITNRRKFDAKVYQEGGKRCPDCGRPEYISGGVRAEHEIDLPDEGLTFFSPDKQFNNRGYQVFLTEDVVRVLQRAEAKGGELDRLWTAEELQRIKDDPKWRRKDACISLGQHRYGPTE